MKRNLGWFIVCIKKAYYTKFVDTIIKKKKTEKKRQLRSKFNLRIEYLQYRGSWNDPWIFFHPFVRK